MENATDRTGSEPEFEKVWTYQGRPLENLTRDELIAAVIALGEEQEARRKAMIRDMRAQGEAFRMIGRPNPKPISPSAFSGLAYVTV